LAGSRPTSADVGVPNENPAIALPAELLSFTKEHEKDEKDVEHVDLPARPKLSKSGGG